MIMPESRDRLVRDEIPLGDLTSLADLQAFAIQRGFTAASVLSERRRRINSHGRDIFGILNDNKDNIPRGGLSSSQYRRSPLPAWYPRTPLRDITHIVNALERQRSRQRAATMRRRNREGGTSSPVPLLTGPATPEPTVAQQRQTTPTMREDVGISLNPAGPIEVFVEVADSPDNGPAMNDRNIATGKIAPEKKYLTTVDEIKRVASGNLRLRDEKPVKKIQRSTLMMMR